MRNGLLVIAVSFIIACSGGSTGGKKSSSTSTKGSTGGSSGISPSNSTQNSGPGNPAFSFSPSDVNAYFSPNGGAKDAIVQEIQNAQKGIKMQAFALTVPDIIKALASKNGQIPLDIRLDKTNFQSVKGTHPVVSAGLPHTLDAHPSSRRLHNKVMIIDDETVITGSNDFNPNGEFNNADNTLIIKNKDLATKYNSNWDRQVKGQFLSSTKESISVPTANNSMNVCFGPYQDCEKALGFAIRNAKNRILVGAANSSSKPIFDSLLNQKSKVKVVASGRSYTPQWDKAFLDGYSQQGLDIKIVPTNLGKNAQGEYHSKVMIIDDMVVTGSYGFTSGATLDAENMLFIRNQQLADQYATDWQKYYNMGANPSALNLFHADIQDAGELSSTYAMRTGGVTGLDLLTLNEGIYRISMPIYSKIIKLKDNEMSGYFMLNTGCFWLGYNHYSQAVQHHYEKSAITCFKMGENFLETQIGSIDNTHAGCRYMLTFGRDFHGGLSPFIQYQHRNLTDSTTSIHRIEKGMYVGFAVEKDIQTATAKMYIDASIKTGAKCKNVGHLNSFEVDNQLKLGSNSVVENLNLTIGLSLTNLQKSSATMGIGLEL